MAIIKKLTPEQRAMKDALGLRALSLYREKRKLEHQIKGIDERINHLEKQAAGIGGCGVDIEETLLNINKLP